MNATIITAKATRMYVDGHSQIDLILTFSGHHFYQNNLPDLNVYAGWLFHASNNELMKIFMPKTEKELKFCKLVELLKYSMTTFSIH